MQNFNQLIAETDYKLERAALLLAKEIAYKDLDITGCIHRLDDFARGVGARCAAGASVRETLQAINAYLFDEQGFQGNTAHYYDPRNSFLNDVLVRHTGIPITLSILYIAVAERLGLHAYGVGLPGHFIVGCDDDNGGTIYIDPFHEGLFLEAEECRLMAEDYIPHGMSFSNDYLLPQGNRSILLRMLNNLRQIYFSRQDAARLLGVLHLQSLLLPANVDLKREVGMLAIQQQVWGLAVRNLRAYYYNYPQGTDNQAVKAHLDEAIRQLSRLN